MKGQIQSLEVSYLLHATEDPEKVEGAVKGLFTVAGETETEALEGHFGNPISRVKQRFTGEEAEEAFRDLGARMAPGLRAKLAEGMEGHLDEHSSLFLRFDKQALVSGTLSFGSADAVHVKVKPRLFALRGKPAEVFARLLSGGEG